MGKKLLKQQNVELNFTDFYPKSLYFILNDRETSKMLKSTEFQHYDYRMQEQIGQGNQDWTK